MAKSKVADPMREWAKTFEESPFTTPDDKEAVG